MSQIHPGQTLVRGVDAELNPQIPWLGVFVDGVVIVGSIVLALVLL